MEQLEKIIKQMLDVGFTQSQINELIDVSDLDIVSKIGEDAFDTLPEDKLNEYKTRLEGVPTPEEKAKIIIELAKLIYGDQAEEKKAKIIADILSQILEQTKAAKELYKKYQAGDPDAVNKVQAAMKTEEFTQMLEEQKKSTAV